PPRARRRLATGRTVHAEPALKFGDMGSQRRNQRNEFFSRWLCLRFGIHRILESKSDSAAEKILHGCLREKMQPNLASYGCSHVAGILRVVAVRCAARLLEFHSLPPSHEAAVQAAIL